MTKNEKIIIVVAIILLLPIVGFGFYYKLWREVPQQEAQKPVENSQEAIKELQENKYSPEVPKDAVQTKPQEVVVLENSNGNQQGTFSITASAGGYTPRSITVKKGDIITLNFTAQGATYDMYSSSIGFYISAANNETKDITT